MVARRDGSGSIAAFLRGAIAGFIAVAAALAVYLLLTNEG